MDISKDLYKTGDIKLLSSYMFDTYESYYKYFQVFGVNKEEFLRIIKKIIERTRNFYNSEDKNYFKKCLFEYLRELLETRKENVIELIVKMFTTSETIYSEDQEIVVLEAFNEITENISVSDLSVIMNNLLTETSTFKNALSSLFEKNKDQITEGNVDKTLSHDLTPYMDYYCSFNNIHVNPDTITESYINSQSGDAKAYLERISPLITQEEEREALKAGDYVKVIRGNCMLAASIAKRYENEDNRFLNLNSICLSTLREIVYKERIPDEISVSRYATWRISLKITREIKKSEKEKSRVFIPKNLLKDIQSEPVIATVPTVEIKTQPQKQTLGKYYRGQVFLGLDPKTKLEKYVGCSHEELLKLINYLTPSQREKLKDRFGEDYKDVIPMKDTTIINEISPIINELIKMKNLLEALERSRNKINNGSVQKAKKRRCARNSGKHLWEYIGCLEEDIPKLRNQLKDYKYSIIAKYLGEDLKGVIPNSDDFKIEGQPIIREMKKAFLTPNYKKPRNYGKYLWERVGCPKEEIKAFVKKLRSKSDQDSLKEQFGDNFDEYKDVNGETRKRNNIIINKLKKIYFNPSYKIGINKKGNLWERVGCPKKEIKALVEKLRSKSDQDSLKEQFGDNFDEYKDVNGETRKRNNEILKKLKKIYFNSNNIMKNGKRKYLWERVGCPKEEIKALGEKLPKSDQESLKEQYGDNFDEYKTVNKEIQKRNNEILKKLKKLYFNSSYKIRINKKGNLWERVGCPKEEIKALVEKLPKSDQESLKEEYGDNFDEPKTVNREIQKRNSEILKKLKKLYFNPSYKIRINKIKYLWEYVGCTQEEANRYVLFLSEDQVKVLRSIFGDSFDETKEVVDSQLLNILNPIIIDLKKIKNDINYAIMRGTKERKNPETYDEAIKEIGECPITRKIILTSLKIKDKRLALSLFGLSEEEKEECVEPVKFALVAQSDQSKLSEIKEICCTVLGGLTDRLSINHRALKGSVTILSESDDKEEKENYIKFIKNLRAIPYARNILVAKNKIKDRQLAIRTFGLPVLEGEPLVEPILPSAVEGKNLNKMEIIRDITSKGVIQRTEINRKVILRSLDSVIGDVPDGDTPMKKAKRPSKH